MFQIQKKREKKLRDDDSRRKEKKETTRKAPRLPYLSVAQAIRLCQTTVKARFPSQIHRVVRHIDDVKSQRRVRSACAGQHHFGYVGAHLVASDAVIQSVIARAYIANLERRFPRHNVDLSAAERILVGRGERRAFSRPPESDVGCSLCPTHQLGHLAFISSSFHQLRRVVHHRLICITERRVQKKTRYRAGTEK